MVDLLLFAKKTFGLEVEVKSEERVVGSWSIELNLRGAANVYVSQVKANLYVCASSRGDPRATGAFLVIRQWWVTVSDKEQLEQLYFALSTAVLERLEALVESGSADTREVYAEGRACVLFLLDERRLDRKHLSLERLQSQMLADLDGGHAVPGLDLRVAHGKGTGTQPTLAWTLPMSLDCMDSRPEGAGVFVPEAVSPKNARWNKRASDRESATLHYANLGPSVAGSPRAFSPATDKQTHEGLSHGEVTERVLGSMC